MTPIGPGVVATRVSFVLVIALTLQVSVIPDLRFFGVQGDLMLLVALAAGLAAGPERGAAIGFVAGLGYDLLLQTPCGLSALTYALVAFFVGSLQDSVLRAAWWIPVTTAAAGSALGVILYVVFGTVVGVEFLGVGIPKVAIVVALLNALVAAPTIRALRWATGTQDSVRARGVPVNGDNPRLRLSILGVVAFSLFAALFARLWYLQVMAADQYNVAARANSTREVLVEAPRGRILDRNGKTIVDNRISVQVTIDRSALSRLTAKRREEVLGKVADALASTSNPQNVAQIEDRINDQRFSPYVPVPIASDVPEQLKIWIDEHQSELPSVAAERVAVRDYPYGRLAADVVGYTGQVTKDELDAVPKALQAAKRYELNDEIGKYGVEKQYEEYLRGTPGRRLLEVDAEGNPIRVIEEDPPIPGDDLVLNLDIGVQAVAEQALKSGLDKASKRPSFGYDVANVGQVGSTVVLDPKNGGVLAMASYPNFAPADFVDGISQSEWDFLQADANHHPLNNWALQGQYAPGSTLKPFSAASGLAAGLLTPHTTIQDQGKYTIPNCKDERCDRFNDQRKKYGQVDLQRSLTVSSDVYYYGLGAQFWINRDRLGGPETFRTLLEQWGFFQKTQIDIPGEQRGRIPSPKWKKEYCAQITCIDSGWFTGDSVNAAVGQGDDLVTPLQLASAYATLGNGGTRWQPQVVQQILDGESHAVKKIIKPRELGRVEVSPEGRQIIINGLIGVTTQDGGTAVGAFSGFQNAAFPIAAKTGTAQVSGKAPTAVFGAFGPATVPSYAISVLMEESGYGGSAAAPVARRLFDVLSGSVPMPDPLATVQGPDLTELSPDPGDVRD